MKYTRDRAKEHARATMTGIWAAALMPFDDQRRLDEAGFADNVRHWWRTSIIDMAPGQIEFRGHPIQDLIGNVSFAQMIWLMTRGTLPGEAEARLLEASGCT